MARKSAKSVKDLTPIKKSTKNATRAKASEKRSSRGRKEIDEDKLDAKQLELSEWTSPERTSNTDDATQNDEDSLKKRNKRSSKSVRKSGEENANSEVALHKPVSISITKSSREKASAAVYFSFIRKGKKDSAKADVHINQREITKFTESALQTKAISGKLKEATAFRLTNWNGYENTCVIGLGVDWGAEQLRQAGASALKALKALKIKSADIWVDEIPLAKIDLNEALAALCEGIWLSDYVFDQLKSKKSENENGLEDIAIVTTKASDRQIKQAVEDARVVTECVNFSRLLGDLPGNYLTPKLFAERVVDFVQGTRIRTEIWDKARIEKERMGGLLGVSQGSVEEPRFVILEYRGAAATKKPVVFVGKGVTFDTGGISIKPSASMEEMKYDMCGAANVAGAVAAIARLGLKVNVVGLMPATENMPSGSATKPSDVHRARNGKTFEINNTDAEGRLILADALCYGSELEPQIMVDAATLTGAMLVALGNIHTGFFTRDEKLAKQIWETAEASGELVWRMPLTDYHVEDIKGTFADLSNISSAKGAGSATAAAFLEQFVEKGVRWAHFDIAGTAWAVGNRHNYYTPKGASGAIVRTFIELARQYT